MKKIKSNSGVSFFKALSLKYQAEIAEATATLEVYFEKAVGIGEHSELMEEYDKWIIKLTDATDKLETLNKYFKISE